MRNIFVGSSGYEDVVNVSGIYSWRWVAVKGPFFHLGHVHVGKKNPKWGSHRHSINLSEEFSLVGEEWGLLSTGYQHGSQDVLRNVKFR